MGELSHLTASPLFDAWDAEVFVIDSDSGTPVLLVRPSTPGTDTPSSNSRPRIPQTLHSRPSCSTLVWMRSRSRRRAEEPEDAAAESDEPVEPPSDETPAGKPDTPADPEDVFVAESEPPVEVVDAAWATAVEETTADEGLKGALKRTAAKMEAEGISAPDSVGPAAAVGALAGAVVADATAEPSEASEPAVEPTAEQDAGP